MKLLTLPLLAGLMFFGCYSAVGATIGACSYHEGVNCSVGPTPDGKVVCNDGWVNSSVYYSDSDECKVKSSICDYPTQPYCSLSDIKSREASALGSARAMDGRSGLLGSDFANSNTSNIEAQYDSEYQSCQSQWNAFESQQKRFDTCINSSSKTDSLMAKAQNLKTQDQLNKICASKNGKASYGDLKKFNAGNDNPCTPTSEDFTKECKKIHPDSFYNPVDSLCSCGIDLVFDSTTATCVKEKIAEKPVIKIPVPTEPSVRGNTEAVKPAIEFVPVTNKPEVKVIDVKNATNTDSMQISNQDSQIGTPITLKETEVPWYQKIVDRMVRGFKVLFLW